MPKKTRTRIEIDPANEAWVNSNVVFENGDGTRYTCHFMPARHGGVYVIVNESSCWRYHGNGDIKFLCGINNDFTRIAILQLCALQNYDELWSAYL